MCYCVHCPRRHALSERVKKSSVQDIRREWCNSAVKKTGWMSVLTGQLNMVFLSSRRHRPTTMPVGSRKGKLIENHSHSWFSDEAVLFLISQPLFCTQIACKSKPNNLHHNRYRSGRALHTTSCPACGVPQNRKDPRRALRGSHS